MYLSWAEQPSKKCVSWQAASHVKWRCPNTQSWSWLFSATNYCSPFYGGQAPLKILIPRKRSFFSKGTEQLKKSWFWISNLPSRTASEHRTSTGELIRSQAFSRIRTFPTVDFGVPDPSLKLGWAEAGNAKRLQLAAGMAGNHPENDSTRNWRPPLQKDALNRRLYTLFT